MTAPDPQLVFVVAIAAFGLFGIGAGVFLAWRAELVGSPFADLLGGWVISAVRAIGILVALLGLAFILVGALNVSALI